MALVAEGRHAGGRSYGYQLIFGKPGELVVKPDEAEIIREIFEAVAKGIKPRTIARDLNARGVPGPRGGQWNASTISGSKSRHNGILNNQLYIGKYIWNRQKFLRDPETDQRLSRLNPQSEWKHYDLPDLRIVSDELWQGAQNRRTNSGAPKKRSALHLLSGLIKCGCCGTSYVVSGSSPTGGKRLACSGYKERGTCTNKRTLSMNMIESKVINGLQEKLAAPDVVETFVREYNKERSKLIAEDNQRRSKLTSERDNIEAKIKRFIQMIGDGVGGKSIAAEILALEKRLPELDAEIAAQGVPQISAHPGAAKRYGRMLTDLRATLAAANDMEREELHAQIRQLIERIIIHPRGPGEPVDIEVHGHLAALLNISRAAQDNCVVVGKVVAGAGFEPAAFRL